MKKLYILLLLSLTFNLAVSAQEYKKFKFGLGLGLSLSGPARYAPSGGILITLEPAYRVSDEVTVGLRLEQAANRIDEELVAIGILSFTINSQYYFTNGKSRLFLGAGLGLFNSSDFYSISNLSVFGYYPRVGFDTGHFSVSMDYNLISSPERFLGYRDNYFGIRIGGFFGGGKMISPQTIE